MERPSCHRREWSGDLRDKPSDHVDSLLSDPTPADSLVAHVRRSGDSLQEFLSFYCLGCGGETQMPALGDSIFTHEAISPALLKLSSHLLFSLPGVTSPGPRTYFQR